MFAFFTWTDNKKCAGLKSATTTEVKDRHDEGNVQVIKAIEPWNKKKQLLIELAQRGKQGQGLKF